jgi:hypothetical protein
MARVAQRPRDQLHPNGAPEATRLLRSTLERLVDFDRINEGKMRLSVGAVNVRTGKNALSLTLTPEELQTLDAAHPAPDR